MGKFAVSAHMSRRHSMHAYAWEMRWQADGWVDEQRNLGGWLVGAAEQ